MDEKRYCGQCRQGVEPGAGRCPHCGGDLPSSQAAPLAAHTPSSGGASSSGGAPAGPTGTTASPSPAGLSPPGAVTQSPRLVTPVKGDAVQAAAEPGSRRSDPARTPAAEDSVGNLPTIHPSGHAAGDEHGFSWTEGMLISDRFSIVRCIGQGGMGMVYLAHDQSLDRPIALKRVPQEILFDGDARDDLRQEANRLLDLAHENIIRVHTYYDEPAWPFFAMEYLQGPTLKELLRSRKLEGSSFSPEEVLVVARQVERGLTYAHGKGVIHRDLKPGNLMFAAPPGKVITDRDVLKITDFGISRVVADSTLRQTGKRSGTLPYMSPEQFRGEPASSQSDVYSLAASYYELLAGKPPFYTGDIGYQIVHIGPRPLTGVPRPLADAILRGLSKSPARRPATVKELTEAMEGRAGSPIRLALRRSRRQARGIALAALALLAAGLAVYWVKNYDPGLSGGETHAGVGPASREAASPSLEGTARASGAPKAGEVADPDLLVRVAREIRVQLRDAGLRDSVNRTSFRILLKKKGELIPEYLYRVQFLLSPLDQPDREPMSLHGHPPRDGKTEGFEFEIGELWEGEWVLRTVLFEIGLPKGAPTDLTFKVDLTGPTFELGPADREELKEIEPGRFVTYNEETELGLSTPLNPGDIQEAYYQIYADSLGRFGEERFKIADPARWRVTLVPGQNRFQVGVADHLGNETVQVVRIDRLKLEVVKFEVDRQAGGVVGNRVWVRGELKMENVKLRLPGQSSAGKSEERLDAPQLRWLVNEQPVVPEDPVDPTPESPFFKARLLLPRHTNTIEVRYLWGGDHARPFAVASSARLAQEVPAPRVELAAVPTQTARTDLEVAGKVVPWFEGLEVHLLHEPIGSVRLQLNPARDQAEFSEKRQLVENRLNRFSITCTYRGQPLSPEGPTRDVYCDISPPRFLDPAEFRPQGEFLLVTVAASEALAQLQVKAPDGEWRSMAPRNDDRYTSLLPLPREKGDFHFKLIDLAGNENVVQQGCPLFDPGSGTEVAGGKNGPATAREGEARPVPAVARPLVARSTLLVDLDLEFKPFGGLDEEMGTTEVNERAWNAFLRDRLQSRVPEGDRKKPITMGDGFDSNLLTHFTRWLTDKSDDGYVYSIPTVTQWQAAFTGARTPREAVEGIRAWFRGEDPRKRFQSSVRVRYGLPEVLPIGSRPENRTPSGLLDMESNLQEIVTDEIGLWYVIGGQNSLREEELPEKCLRHSLFSTATEDWAGKYTGFRLLRKPGKR